jgi:hypothetical protein
MTIEREKVSHHEYRTRLSGNHGSAIGLLTCINERSIACLGAEHYAKRAAEIVAEHDAIKLLEIDYLL